MAISVQHIPETQLPQIVHTADLVGNAFVQQYYLILQQSPELVHRFYQDNSKLGRPDENGVMGIATTMQGINDKILSLDHGRDATILSIDAQESFNDGVLVLVTGFLTFKDNVRRKFTQSFFLAPQDNVNRNSSYFVLNDVFRYVDVLNDVEPPITPDQDPLPVQENHVSDQIAVSSEEANGEEANGEEVYDPSENGDGTVEEEEAPVPEVVDEIPDDTHVDAQSNSKIEQVPKKSYASIVKKDSAAPVSSPTPSSLRTIMKIQEQQPASGAILPSPVSEGPGSSTNAIENGNNQEAEGPSIYIKGLPSNASHAQVEEEFKKFGTIRSGGIQIKIQQGFSFGFVEFEEESAVHLAIEASPILIGGRRVIVEQKKSTRGGNRRFSSGPGTGYRNEGARGRGYGGGRGYGRGDFVNRTESESRNGSRGGFSNRGGGEGYQRNDQTGSTGGRGNRSGRFKNVDAAAKSVAPRVPASA